MHELVALLPLGLAAGALTTLVGVGGGMFMTVAMATWLGPQTALAIAAPALLVGNLHRLWQLRAHFSASVWRWVGITGALGSVAGGLLVAELPNAVVALLIAGATFVAVLQEMRGKKFVLPRSLLAPGGFVTGVLTASSGGGGLVLAPLLLSTGLRGEAFVATGASVAATLHVARIATYSGTGMLGVPELAASAVLAVGILAGNAIALRQRGRFAEELLHKMTWATMLGTLALALALALTRAA